MADYKGVRYFDGKNGPYEVKVLAADADKYAENVDGEVFDWEEPGQAEPELPPFDAQTGQSNYPVEPVSASVDTPTTAPAETQLH